MSRDHGHEGQLDKKTKPRPRQSRKPLVPLQEKHLKAQRAIARGKPSRKPKRSLEVQKDARITASDSSDDSDEAFDSRPRRLPGKVIANRRAESRTIEDNRCHTETKPIILCTTLDVDFEDKYVSQSAALATDYSSPSRPRGAIWVRSPVQSKKATAPAPIPVSRPQSVLITPKDVTADCGKPKEANIVPEKPSGVTLRASFADVNPSNRPTTVLQPQRTALTVDQSRFSAARSPNTGLQAQQAPPMPTRQGTDRPRALLEDPIDGRRQVQQESPKNAVLDTHDLDAAMVELADLPSDAFASSPPVAKTNPRVVSSPARHAAQTIRSAAVTSTTQAANQISTDNTGKRQTTLWGTTAVSAVVPAASKSGPAVQPRKPAWRASDKVELPTHHELDWEAAKTWLYPMNLGTIRDYQYSIVSVGLFHNSLVALPTGLGKTFIAATIMLNWFRWTKSAQIVFVAPTKPLVAQQIEACSNIVGIPKSQTTMMTGEVTSSIRAQEWLTKRVFFMTPQTLDNDLEAGRCDPKRLVLLVVDEAHRATGSYAYVEIVKRISNWNKSFRVLALTATPGDKVEKIQQVIDGLHIARCEIRTENSIDIRGYIHTKETEIKEFTYSHEQVTIMDLLSTILKPLLSKLGTNGAFGMSDPLKISAYGLKQTMDHFMRSEAGRNANQGQKGMMRAIAGTLTALATPLVLLKFFSITPFYNALNVFRNEVESGTGDHGRSKYAKQIVEHANFTKMMNYMKAWVGNPQFVGHPKLEHLQGVVLQHFTDAQEGQPADHQSSTRVMVFANYRDAAEDIVRVLARNSPMVKPHVFVGQTGTARSDGMNQKKQLETVKKFKEGTINVLVATSIGEEGLDIGEIDLIICYDASSSPIRMLQRMGRTGRKRRGKIVLLLMEEKEARDFAKAKDNYEAIQGMIANGNRFAYCDDESPRILPKEITPVVNKCIVEVPPENSQPGLPEPRRTNKRPPKRPPKKFSVPDGVETGFVKASRLNGDDDVDNDADLGRRKKRRRTDIAAAHSPARPTETVIWPAADQVALNKVQEKELERKFQYVNSNATNQTIMAPQPEKHPSAFANLSKTKYVRHGHVTTRIAQMMQSMRNMNTDRINEFRDALVMSDVEDNPDEDHEINEAPPLMTQESLVPAEDLMPITGKGRQEVRNQPRVEGDAVLQEVHKISTNDLSDLEEMMPPPRRVEKATAAASDFASPIVVSKSARPVSDRLLDTSPVGQVSPSSSLPTPHITLSSTNTPYTAPRPPDRYRAPHHISSAIEADCSSSIETSPEMRRASQGIDLGMGDTSGEDESEGEPDSELASFVVNSDVPIERVSSSLPMTDGVALGAVGHGRHGRANGLSQLFTDETEVEPEVVLPRKRLVRKRPGKIVISDDEADVIRGPAAKRQVRPAQAVHDTDEEDALLM